MKIYVSSNTSILIELLIIFLLLKSKNFEDIKTNKEYINLCKKAIKLYEEKKDNIKPFFTICIPVYNMEKYIEISLLSVLNQSFRNFEIVIINDHSLDNSENIIKKLQSNNSQIKMINHDQNYGIYQSRVDAIRNSKGKYIIFLDPDDLFCNADLLRDLYEFNLNKNLDFIEFAVIIQEESKKKLYYPLEHRRNHFHNFNEEIIYQPYLSNILFFEKNEYSDVFCRCIWNKMVKKQIFEKTINFLGNRTYQQIHFNLAEDTIINIINFEFAYNFSNLNLIGYMYNIREDSMSHSQEKKAKNLKMGQDIVFFYYLFYTYIKYFNKDLNYLYYDLKAFDYYIKYIIQKSCSSLKKKPILNFYNNLIREKNISSEFKKYAKRFLRNSISKNS